MSGHSCALFSTSHLLTHLPPPFAYPGQRTYPAGFPVAPSTLRSLVRTGLGPRTNGRTARRSRRVDASMAQDRVIRVFNLFSCVYTRNHRRAFRNPAGSLFITAQRNGERVQRGTRRCVSSSGRFRGGKISATYAADARARSRVNPRSDARLGDLYSHPLLHPTGSILS